jgi:hypothetical protein
MTTDVVHLSKTLPEQKTQWPKEKGQKDKQRSTKHTHKTKDRVTRTPLKTGGELSYSREVAVPAPLVTPVVLI